MDDGKVAEFDTPQNLLSPSFAEGNNGVPSLFAALVSQWDSSDH